MFRSTDNGDTWTEQNGGFTAFDVTKVVINPIGHIFAGATGGVSRSMNDAGQCSDVRSGLLPRGGNVWGWRLGDLHRRICLCRNCWRRCLSKRLIYRRGAGYSETEASSNASPGP